MNDKKLCESAYLAATDPQTGPYIHGAAMIDRTTGATHVWLVRGECSVSVVEELQSQLIKAGRLKTTRIDRRRGQISSFTALTIGVLAAGLHALMLGFTHSR